MNDAKVTTSEQDTTCHSTAGAVPLAGSDAETLATTLKAVADPTRLQLLSLIAAAPGGEACVCDLADSLGLCQPTISHHLKLLVDAGLLTKDKRGTWAWFTLVHDRLGLVGSILKTVIPVG
ncbi:ArsR/SmtB family transcription factor [Embleya sp. NPDC050493]|uniref:ArsR/SmtB family transcription factor n=1 Tax=Embleya sp. NPDC050493 TaxID=3363989 RepID=UPI0037945179